MTAQRGEAERRHGHGGPVEGAVGGVARPRTAALTAMLAVAVVAALSGPPSASAQQGRQTETGPPPGKGPLVYEAEIRRTAFGIPHIRARDYDGLGFGAGYAYAEDNLCVLARRFVQVGAEQARYFGATADNVRSDFFHQRLIDAGIVERMLEGDDQPGPSTAVRALWRGYAAGYSRFLRETGVDNLPDPACRGAEWVREIDEVDLWRHSLASLLRAGQAAPALQAAIVAAAPPVSPGAAPQSAPVEEPDAASAPTAGAAGSNAYALGRDATVAGGGMVLANPHFPWHGHDRFYRMHLHIPGELNVTGASLHGNPVVHIGHTATLAWSHTVSTAQRFTIYRLTLAPDSPTTYLYDGEPREMTPQEVTIRVPGPDGTLEERTHTFWETHFGPVVVLPGVLPWTTTTAFAVRDANIDNARAGDAWLAMNKAGSVAELRAALDRHQGIPWVNTIAADAGGVAFYGDHSVVPHVTAAKMAACGFPLMDGSRSECEWGSDPDAAAPGIFGPSSLPLLERTDYTANMNNSHWLANPEQPLEGFSPILGPERSNIGLRPRLGLLMVEQRLAGTDELDGTGFTLDRLQAIMFNNRNYGAELVRDDLVAHCRANPTVRVGDADVDLSEACDVLADWDLRVDRDSRGAHVFREFVGQGGLRFAVPFDPEDPVNTPRTLDAADARVLAALGQAVQRLRDANIPLDARWGDVQFVERAGERIEIHGGAGGEGVFNVITSAPLQPGLGYPEVSHGASFVMAAELTPDGPRSRAILSYSQSASPESPHFADQTRLYSDKVWVDMKFDEAAILADPELRTYTVRESMDDCRGSGWQAFERPAFRHQGECLRYFASRAVQH
jgi:acyl-homoserine-lactone acylase